MRKPGCSDLVGPSRRDWMQERSAVQKAAQKAASYVRLAWQRYGATIPARPSHGHDRPWNLSREPVESGHTVIGEGRLDTRGSSARAPRKVEAVT